jgi:hypothetical protein
MKNLIILAFCLISTFKLNAQCADDINTTSTDWRNYPATSDNEWDWTLSGLSHPIYLDNNLSVPNDYIELPYFCSKPPNTGSCDGFQNVGQYQFKGLGKEYQDINPEDGWELLLKDFGTPNPIGETTGGFGRNNPYFILYNKFTGRMKIYVAMMGIQSKQAAFVRIGFDNNDPGTLKLANTNQVNRALFSAAESVQKTVLEFKPVLEFKQMNQVLAFQSTSDYQWTVCELTTSYDPCTCEDDQTTLSDISALRMQLIGVGTVSIKASIDGKATQENVALGSDASSSADGSLASFFKVVTDGGDAAQKGKATWDKTQKSMKDIVDFGNEVLVKQLAKEWLKKDNPNYDNSAVNSLTKAAIKQLIAAPDSIKKMYGVRQPKDTKLGKILDATKGIASQLPYVGMAIGIIDFMVDGGESVKGDEKSGPVTYDLNLKLSGTLTESQNIADVSFFTPGSPMPSSVGTHLEPSYNNVLGVFSILELPEVEFAELSPTVSLTNEDKPYVYSGSCNNHSIEYNNFEGAGDIKLRQYRPKSNIKYVLNPASELEVQSIEASIVLEYTNDKPPYYPNPNPYTVKPSEISSKHSIPFYNDMFNRSMSLESRVESIQNSTPLRLDFASSTYPDEANTILRLRTEWVPITCFQASSFTLIGNDNIGKVYVKVYVKLKNKSLENSEPVTMVLTYDWTEKVSAAVLNSSLTGTYSSKIRAASTSYRDGLFSCETTYSNYELIRNRLVSLPFGGLGLYRGDNYSYAGEQNLTVEDRLIIPSGISIPDNSVIKAGGLITIESNVSFGTNVEIVSGIKIDLQATNSIYPTVDLRIEPLNLILSKCSDFDYASLHNTDSEISSFCSTQSYLDKAYKSKRTIDDEVQISNIQKILEFRIFPNPTKGEYTLDFDYPLQDVEVTVLDLNGKQVSNTTFSGEQSSVKLDASALRAGVYFIDIRTPQGKIGKERLVKY